MNRRSTCRQCGRSDTKVGRISKRGLCRFCADENMRFAAESLAAKSGPVYNAWKARTERGYGAYVARQLAAIDARARAAERSQHS